MKNKSKLMSIFAIIMLTFGFYMYYATNTEKNKLEKFKNAHEAIEDTIKKLTTSDKYYLDGNLAIRKDNFELLGGISINNGATAKDESTIKYFCETFADSIGAKETNCSTIATAGDEVPYTFVQVKPSGKLAPWQRRWKDAESDLDKACLEKASIVGAEITTKDGVVYYQTNPAASFGTQWYTSGDKKLFATRDKYKTLNTYKPFCMDIDGIGKGEAPFGYGILIDGRIINGTRSQKWIKSAY